MASHLEKQMARVEALVGQEEEPRPVVFLGRDGQPVPGQEPMWHGGTPDAKAAASAAWKKADATRVKKALKRIAEIDKQLAAAKAADAAKAKGGAS